MWFLGTPLGQGRHPDHHTFLDKHNLSALQQSHFLTHPLTTTSATKCSIPTSYAYGWVANPCFPSPHVLIPCSAPVCPRCHHFSVPMLGTCSPPKSLSLYLFNSLCTGFSPPSCHHHTWMALMLASCKYVCIVQKLGFDTKFSEFKTQNIVGNCDVKFPIHLEGLAYSHRQFSSYEPDWCWPPTPPGLWI